MLILTIDDLGQNLTEANFCFTYDRAKCQMVFPLPEGDNKEKSITFLLSPIKLK